MISYGLNSDLLSTPMWLLQQTCDLSLLLEFSLEDTLISLQDDEFVDEGLVKLDDPLPDVGSLALERGLLVLP